MCLIQKVCSATFGWCSWQIYSFLRKDGGEVLGNSGGGKRNQREVREGNCNPDVIYERRRKSYLTLLVSSSQFVSYCLLGMFMPEMIGTHSNSSKRIPETPIYTIPVLSTRTLKLQDARTIKPRTEYLKGSLCDSGNFPDFKSSYITPSSVPTHLFLRFGGKHVNWYMEL